MSINLLNFSMYAYVLDPHPLSTQTDPEDFRLHQVVRFHPNRLSPLNRLPWVVFDLETTGLDPTYDRIIEIGAQKLVNGEVIGEFSTLIDARTSLTPKIQRITGIKPAMLAHQPTIQEAIPMFLDFIQGSLLVAHNASFDMGFLTTEANRLGYKLDWPALCTLKIAREILAHLESKALDRLAQHYGLTFESRHRSIGDVKVTVGVFKGLLENEACGLNTWEDCLPFQVTTS